VDYLLRLASRRLQIARDINSAVAALQAADQRIHDLRDLNLLPVRKQLAKDIAELKALHQVDVNGIALGLEQMINHLDALPFKSVQEEIETQMQDETPAVVEEKPQGFVDSVISTVKNIGDIKVHQRSIQPASSAQQQQQLEQILRTHLLAARLAVLRHEQAQFIHDLQQAQQILHTHYQQSDNRVTQMQTDLAKFSSINLQPELPTITRSWNMLRNIDKDAPAKAKKPAAAEPSSDTSTRQPAEGL
jgi:uroporphyrin-3 C-methyltransferase